MSIMPVTPVKDRGYAHPEVLVDCDWVAAHLDDPNVCLIESNEDLLLYDTGHIPGATKIDWVNDLNDSVVRDYVDHSRLKQLLRERGVNQDSIIVLYGDRNNWWACYAFWVFQLFGIRNCRILDGGRLRWIDESRPLTTDRPSKPTGNVVVAARSDGAIRAFKDEVMTHVGGHRALVDVRSPEEFRGERLHMPDYPNEGAIRGGHIPGAKNVPWARAVDPTTHTFLAAGNLRAIYASEQSLIPGEKIIVYCRIGERSSHTWFVLTYLLGWTNVKNYDGSWTEWGNAVGAPIARP